mgnify:CR=1 FL=1
MAAKFVGGSSQRVLEIEVEENIFVEFPLKKLSVSINLLSDLFPKVRILGILGVLADHMRG